MPAKNLFSEPFDDGTLFKLKIFSDYFKEWFPVFVSPEEPKWKKIQIFDLFAGMGKDQNGVIGSPLIILHEVNKWKTVIEQHKLSLNIVFNDFEKGNSEALEANTRDIVDKNVYDFTIHNNDFYDLFEQYYPSMFETANFIFLDQNGIKQITEEVFSKIMELSKTDFLFFISSSYIKRFADSEAFKKYLKITSQDVKNESYYHMHRVVLKYYRTLVPSNKKYYLAPFSIKKPSGVYGLIFGSNHLYGLEKFLSVCWKHDKLTGEANFDIDNEKIDVAAPSLFAVYNTPKKIQLFESALVEKILSASLTTDLSVYTFGLEEGFLPKHVNNVLTKMIKEKKIKEMKLTSSRIHKISSPSNIIIL